MTTQSEKGKELLKLAREYREAVDMVEQTPVEEIKYVITQYQKVLQQLLGQGLTPAMTPLESLMRKVSKRLEQLLEQTTPKDAEQLKTLTRQDLMVFPALEMVKRLNMYKQNEYGNIILEAMIEQLDRPEDFRIAEDRTRLSHAQDWEGDILFYKAGIIETETHEILSDLVIYQWARDHLKLGLFISDTHQFILASEKVFETIPKEGCNISSKKLSFYPKDC